MRPPTFSSPSSTSSNPPAPPPDPLWHALSAEQVLDALDCLPARGLTPEEAAARLARVGPNALAEAPRRPGWRRFLDQFASLLILILLGAAVLAGLLGDIEDAVVIGLVVVLNASLGFIQENRAERALAALRDMLSPSARVRRNGEEQVVEAASLVPGDLLLLEAGERIAADARVVVAISAEVAEAALTGESAPVAKQVEAADAAAEPADRHCMLFMNTVVTRGRLEAVVTATGMATAMGQLAGLLEQAGEAPTPLQLQLDVLGKRLALIAGVVVALMFAAGLARGGRLMDTALTAIALAVAAIPEGLPAVVTVTLALGMHRMAGRKAIVKKLAAVETLGCTTVICSDKTGTLTLNRMTARALLSGGRHFSLADGDVAGAAGLRAEDGSPVPDLHTLLLPAVLCCDAQLRDGELIGDPTEGALLALANQAGLQGDALREAFPRIAEIPFDSSTKFMATFHREGGQIRMWVKGAPDVLMARASHYLAEAGEAALDGAALAHLQTANAALAGQALRVLALAGRSLPAADFDPDGDLLAWVHDLSLVALVGIIDPPRPEARAAIATCQRAGVEVKMITGDHPLTAAAIAAELGLHGKVREGRELDGLSPAALRAAVADTAVFARVSPTHKTHIVEALRAAGQVVAMTGDGVNDAPALKAADIGVAMGITGTAVSREAATLVLADDNFATIVQAIKEGRSIYDNIVKFVRFQLSTNIGAILTVLAAPFLGFATPFTAIQILWVNIIMDGPPAMTLGLEPARPGIMERPPRPVGAAILSWPRLARIGTYGATMAIGTLGMYAWGLERGGAALASTLAFTTFVLFQLFNIFNARAEHESAFNSQFFSNGRLWAALAGVLALQALVVHWSPARQIFDTVALDALEWGLAALVASTTLLLDEARKLLLRRLTLPEKVRG